MDNQGKPPSLLNRLREGIVQSPLDGKPFLPLDCVEKEIIRANVKAQLPSIFTDLRKPNIYDRILQDAKKVFTILVLIEESKAIKKLLAEGLMDDDLPLSLKITQGSYQTLVSSRRAFESFRDWKEARVYDFLEKQWLVLAPVFNTGCHHIKLNVDCAMPFIDSKEITGGAFSYVHKCELPRAHQKDFDIKDGKILVAVKQFKLNRIKSVLEAFDLEKDNLQRLRSVSHPHMIRHYATCEIESKDDYYVIFPWADEGNLGSYWEKQGSNNISEGWMFGQMLGLTEALEGFHRTGFRHGDLKPDNILLFSSIGGPTLVIGDVGISRFHEKDTFKRNTKTTTEATTPSYQAPEVHGNPDAPRSRTYDIWSFGCVFLEFVIWHLFDDKAVKSFRSVRRASDEHSYFYKLTPEKNVADHPQVTEAIAFLLTDSRCGPGTSFRSLITLISDNMLQLDIKRRTEVSGIVTKLREIVNSAGKNTSPTNNSTLKPFIFQQEAMNGPKDSVMDTSLIPYRA